MNIKLNLDPIEVTDAVDSSIVITFYCRRIMAEEEERLVQTALNISDSDPERHVKRFESYKDAVGAFSYQPPTIRKNGKDAPLVKDATAVEAVQAWFKERNAMTDSMIAEAYTRFRHGQRATSRFLSHSAS